MIHLHHIDRRKKPRIRVLTDGECHYSFAKNSWLVYANIQATYRYLKNNPTTRIAPTAYNSQW